METKRKLEWQYPDKIDFKIKAVTRGRGGHCIMIKGSIQDEVIHV